jgi:type II secretory pathway pseudopilin PulG
MNTRRHSRNRTSRQAGFTLGECLVVVLILVILVVVLLPTFTQALTTPPVQNQRQAGTQIYKAILTKVLDNPDAGGIEFPSSTNGFTTSTQYFIHLVTNGTVNVDFTFFSGPGLPRYQTSNSAAFKGNGNAWSVVLDVSDENSSYPFLISRNLLPADSNVPPQTAALTPAMLGERGSGKKLEFNSAFAVVITKAGSNFLIKEKEFTGAPGSMVRVNPTDVSKPILRP